MSTNRDERNLVSVEITKDLLNWIWEVFSPFEAAVFAPTPLDKPQQAEPPEYCHTEYVTEIKGDKTTTEVKCVGKCDRDKKCPEKPKQEEIEVTVAGKKKKVGVIEWCECEDQSEEKCNLMIWWRYAEGDPTKKIFLYGECSGSEHCAKERKKCTTGFKVEDIEGGKRRSLFCYCK